MKIKHKLIEMPKEIGRIRIFKHKGRICVVIEMLWMASLKVSPYCNGYVEVSAKNKGKNYDNFIDRIETDELTFSGDLSRFNLGKKLWFFGFDSAHFWNDAQPESKTFKSVKARTSKLCEEMVKKGI